MGVRLTATSGRENAFHSEAAIELREERQELLGRFLQPLNGDAD